MSTKRTFVIIRIFIVALFAVFLILRALMTFSKHTAEDFEVRGVDVSAHQGLIDWEKLSENDLDFAFIKATEGSSFKDRFYSTNIKGIKETEIAPGAYHFLSFESDGKSQAQNFISSVEAESILLPPVIDLELYGDYNKKPPSNAEVRTILDEMIPCLYEEYGRYPIIYTTRRAYALYVSGVYENCDIWICDIMKKPSLPDGRKWHFWQYSHTEKLSGYSGSESHIDMNVFFGSEKEFEEYIKNP